MPILISASVRNFPRERLLLDKLMGTDVDTSVALHKYYELLASTLRLLVSVFVSRGQENQQSKYQMRNFLAENRLNMVGAFKRDRGVGGEIAPESRAVLEDVVKSYVALMTMADFMQVRRPQPCQAVRSEANAVRRLERSQEVHTTRFLIVV